MNLIEQKLRDVFGLEPSALGSQMLQRAVRQRLRCLGLKHPAELWQLLDSFPAQWLDLAELLVITETWFFRDRQAFTTLAQLVRDTYSRRRNDPESAFAQTSISPHLGYCSPIRLLSVPCASGEEPLSIVMALLDAGIPAAHFSVDALDLSPTALACARQGMYRKNAFRGEALDFRARYFTASPQGFIINPAVGRRVRFSQGNLLDPACLPDEACYDFIFCRNLLIYLHPAAQQTILAKLQRLLAPTGMLFVGPAEQILATEFGFGMANIPLAFACRPPAPSPISRSPAAESVRPLAHFDRAPAMQEIALPQPPEAEPDTQSADLQRARALADAGRLTEAAALCESHLCHARTSAQAYYLLGLVRDAAGDDRAGDCYRKALYLEPNHYESLLQLAMLAHQRGDEATARTLRLRAERLNGG